MQREWRRGGCLGCPPLRRRRRLRRVWGCAWRAHGSRPVELAAVRGGWDLGSPREGLESGTS